MWYLGGGFGGYRGCLGRDFEGKTLARGGLLAIGGGGGQLPLVVGLKAERRGYDWLGMEITYGFGRLAGCSGVFLENSYYY